MYGQIHFMVPWQVKSQYNMLKHGLFSKVTSFQWSAGVIFIAVSRKKYYLSHTLCKVRFLTGYFSTLVINKPHRNWELTYDTHINKTMKVIISINVLLYWHTIAVILQLFYLILHCIRLIPNGCIFIHV